MLEGLRQAVCEANRQLPAHALVLLTWGNASGLDRKSGLFVIKPSGVAYDRLTPEDMVIVDLDGHVVEGRLRPSSDTPTHAALYRRFPDIGGCVHTHSTWAAAWAQAGRSIPCYGTTHADDFYGSIPCVRPLTRDEIRDAYEENTGLTIAGYFREKQLDPSAVPGVLCSPHGVFTWGKDAAEAVQHAVVLEECARMAAITEMLNKDASPVSQELLDKHYLRKHGAHASYGQQGL